MTGFGKGVVIGTAALVAGFFGGIASESGLHNSAFDAARDHYEPICERSITTSPEQATQGTPEGERHYVAALCTAYFKGAEFATRNVVSRP